MSEEVMIPKSYHDKVCEEIIRFKDKQFYDAVHLLDDGTLEITVGDYTKVKRVLVEDDNNFGNLFYEDEADRPQGEWITCSEKMPEESGSYLTWSAIGLVPDHVDKPNTYEGITIASFSKDSRDWFGAEKVYAWMPLPKPWKGADDESS